MHRIILLVYIIAAVTFGITAQSTLCGPWHGFLSLGQQRLTLVLNISGTGDSLNATLDSPAQNAKGIPATITVSNDSITVKVPVIGASYSGSFDGVMIKGTFASDAKAVTDYLRNEVGNIGKVGVLGHTKDLTTCFSTPRPGSLPNTQ